MHSEVLIIGGGVIGLSIARELHKQGVKRITLLEKGVCGKEASWAAAGMLVPQTEAGQQDAFFELCCASRDLYPSFASELSDETGIDIELDRTGTLYLAFDDNDISEIHQRFEWQRNAGLTVERLSQNELRKYEPAISKTACEALFFKNDWQVENRQLVSALRSYAEINGIGILENTRVERLIVEENRVIGAETPNGRISAAITVLATGAWTSLIKIGNVDMPFKVEPVRGQILAFQPATQILGHVVCSSSGYLVPRRDGRILAGSTTENVGFDKTGTGSAAALIKEMAGKIVPTIDNLEIADHWTGLRPFVSDGKPVLGPINDLDGLFIATAHYRNGILLAPLTAKLVADKFVNGTDSEYFTTFGADRFRRCNVVSTS